MKTILTELRSSRDQRQAGDNDSALPSVMDVEPAPRPLRIALIYSRIPFPLMRGDQLTVANLISFLSARGHSVDFYSLNCGGQMSSQQSEWLAENCRSVRLYDQKRWDNLRGIALGLSRRWPAQVGYFSNRSLKREVSQAILRGEYDIVYTYYIRSAQAVPEIFSPNRATVVGGRRCAAFLAMQLSQYLNVGRMANRERSFLRRQVYKLEQKLLGRYEGRIWQKFTKTCLIGTKDVLAVEEACRQSANPKIDNVVFSAHGTDVKRFRMPEPWETVPGRIVFSGNMGYRPNIEAVTWFVSNCWDAIKQRVPGASLMIVGRDPGPEIRELEQRDGIRVTGTVEDVGAYIRSASVCINPMQAAGGMQNKLVEYLACGSVVVATRVANEGVGAPAEAIRLADSPHDFIEAVVQLLENPDAAGQMRDCARRFAEESWTWESHFLKLEANFFDAIES